MEPYFIDISRSQDMTAQLDVETSTRIGGQLEYRLVNGEKDHISVTGSFFNESIRSEQNRLSDDVDPQIADPTIPINRWGFVGLMQEYLTPSLFTYGSLAYGSDSRFFKRSPVSPYRMIMVGRPTGCRAVGCGKRTALQPQTLGCSRNSTIATCNWKRCGTRT